MANIAADRHILTTRNVATSMIAVTNNSTRRIRAVIPNITGNTRSIEAVVSTGNTHTIRDAETSMRNGTSGISVTAVKTSPDMRRALAILIAPVRIRMHRIPANTVKAHTVGVKVAWAS